MVALLYGPVGRGRLAVAQLVMVRAKNLKKKKNHRTEFNRNHNPWLFSMC